MPFDGNSSEYSDPILQDLLQARERLSKGWIQHYALIVGNPPKYCILGAMNYSKSQRFVENLLPIYYCKRLATWNDMPWRQHKAVLRLMDRAINQRKAQLTAMCRAE